MSAAPWAIVVPLLGALVSLLVPVGRWTRRVSVAAVAGTVGASEAVALEVWRHGASRYSVGGWPAPLGIELQVDGLASLAAFVCSVVMLALSGFAIPYFASPSNDRSWRSEDAFWPLWLLLLTALQALFFSADAFNLYVSLELLTLSAVALVSIADTRGATAAATRYLLAAFLGSLAYLLGVALLYAEAGTLDVDSMGGRLVPGWAAWSAVALTTIGLALKSALFPLHFWLPRAHANAPPPVSAALSGLVVAGSFYVLLRLWFHAFPDIVTASAAQAMGALGALGIVWGGVQAIRQQRLKLMVAYSTISQVGYFFLILPLALATASAAGVEYRAQAWAGGVYLVGAHAFAKSALFLAAGTITKSLGHDRIAGVRGIAAQLPMTTYAFGIAGLTLIGLPPSGGFVGKWLLLSAAIAAGQWWWVIVIIVGGILTAGYIFLVLGQEMSEAKSDEPAVFAPVPRSMELITMALALASLLMGVRAIEPLSLLAIGSPVAGGP